MEKSPRKKQNKVNMECRHIYSKNFIFGTEQESIVFFCRFLKDKGYTDINPTQSKDQFSYYDIDATYMGKRFRFELKRRDMMSGLHNDSVIETHKYKKFQTAKEKNEYDFGYLVSFFWDCFTISPIKESNIIGIKHTKGSRTTDFENDEIINKEFVRFNQNVKRNYNYDGIKN